MSQIRFSVIGAGAGGTLMAVILKSKGYYVSISDKDTGKIAAIKAAGILKATGKTEAEARPNLITADNAECIKDTDVIMVCTTTDAHADVAAAIADTVKDEQTVILNPGHVGGVLNFKTALKNAGCKADPAVCEASDMMFACRTVEPGHTFHSGVKARIKLASVPSDKAYKAAELLKDIFPCYVPVESVLMTGFGGGGGMLHSIPCTLNINKIEMKQQFEYYIEGLTPAVCRVIEKADAERVAVCRALGIEAEPLLQHLKNVYGLKPDDLYEAIQSCEPYRGIKSPIDTNHRFMQEDTLSDLVPTASFGHMLGVPVPTIDMIIELESIMLGKDFKAEGRTVEKLGLEGRTPEEIRELVK